MKRIYVLLTIVSIFWFTACQKNKEAAEFFKRGVYHFKKNEMDVAKHLFSEAIKKSPTLADAYLNRGIIFQNEGDIKNAERDIRKALEIDNGFYDAKLQLAKLLNLKNEFDASDALFKQIESHYPKSSDFYGNWALNAMMQNDAAAAEAHLKKALSLDPKNKEAINNWGYLYFQKNEISSAKEQFEKVLTLDPRHEQALNNMGNVFLSQKDFKPALSYFEKIAEKQNTVFINNMALCLLELNQLEKAQDLIRGSLIKDDKNPYSKRNEAILALKKGESKIALDMFEQIENTNPETEYIYYYLYDVCTKLKLSEKANKYRNIGIKIKDKWLSNSFL